MSEARQVKGGRKDEETPNGRIGSDGYFSGRRNSFDPCKFPFLRGFSISISSGGASPCLSLPSLLSTLSTLSSLWLSGLGTRTLGLEMDKPRLGEGLVPRSLALQPLVYKGLFKGKERAK